MEEQPTIQSIRKTLTGELFGLYDPREAGQIALTTLEYVTGIPRMQLQIQGDTKVSRNEEIQIQEILCKLKKNCPVQYVLGNAWFYGMDFFVNPSVLIPRPETEELVEWILHDFPAFEGNILDIGTGSGCIAVTLAKHCPKAEVHGLDISAEALSVAAGNASRHEVHIDWHEEDILSSTLPFESNSFDLLVSNPPYVSSVQASCMQANVLQYEPRHALFAPGEDPLIFYRRIAALSMQILKSEGKVYVEINEEFPEETAEIFSLEGLSEIEIRKDIHDRFRMLSCQKIRS